METQKFNELFDEEIELLRKKLDLLVQVKSSVNESYGSHSSTDQSMRVFQAGFHLVDHTDEHREKIEQRIAALVAEKKAQLSKATDKDYK